MDYDLSGYNSLGEHVCWWFISWVES